MNLKLTFWKVIFLAIMSLGLYSAFIRYFRGLGAVSNMTISFPGDSGSDLTASAESCSRQVDSV